MLELLRDAQVSICSVFNKLIHCYFLIVFNLFVAHVVDIDEGHDSTIHFVTDVGPTPRARSLSLRHLPLRDVGQLSLTSILY